MSSFILSSKNFEYLKKNIINYMMSEEGSYLVFNFKYFDSFKHTYGSDAFRNFKEIAKFVNNQVNYLNRINVQSFNLQYREDEKVMLSKDITTDNTYYGKLSEETLLQTYQILRCLNYQIEMEFDREFMDKVKNHIACTIASRRIDYINETTEADIKWGL